MHYVLQWLINFVGHADSLAISLIGSQHDHLLLGGEFYITKCLGDTNIEISYI